MKITHFDREIWWQFSWNFWRVGFEIDLDVNNKYFHFKLYLLLFAIRVYIEWD